MSGAAGMNNIIILVATEDEKKALIPHSYQDYVIITGIGYRNVIKTLSALLKSDKIFDSLFINIGYAGSNHGEIGTVYEVEHSETVGNHIYYDYQNSQDCQNLKTPCNLRNKANCFTATDFVAEVDQNTVKFNKNKNNTIIYDMELAAISAFNENTIAYKIVSDHLEEMVYKTSLKNNYHQEIQEILDKIIVVQNNCRTKNGC